MAERTDDELELAHALYTVWMHTGRPTGSHLVAARIRGCGERVPWLYEAYPQLAVLRDG